MKLKKLFSFSDKNQIWRLLISNSDKLIIETRDVEKKEVYFHGIDLQKGKKIFKNLQVIDRFWVGIETLNNDKIIFHKFAKPNMPEHKGIIVFDINTKKIVWQNEDLIFLSLSNNKIYAFKRKFEGRDIYALDYENGEITEELGSDNEKINAILNDSQNDEDFSNYLYPEEINQVNNPEILSLLEHELANDEIQNIAILKFDDLAFVNYYIKNEHNLLDNVFTVYNIDKKKKISAEIINKNLNSFSPDSFFCYKNSLLLLKNKNEIVSYKIV